MSIRKELYLVACYDGTKLYFLCNSESEARMKAVDYIKRSGKNHTIEYVHVVEEDEAL